MTDNQRPPEQPQQRLGKRPCQRWYEQDMFANAVAHGMQHMSMTSQHLFADFLLNLSLEIIESGNKEQFYRNLNPEKLDALVKGKNQKRRWYDQHEALRAAFDQWYLLDETHQGEIAHRLFIPAKLVTDYEQYCETLGSEPNTEVVEQILFTSMAHGAERAMKLYGFYVDANINTNTNS